MPAFNLFQALPDLTGSEHFETLLHHRNVRIERIVSPAAIESRLYCQEQDEWVALLQGQARLELDGRAMDLKAGDSLFIPAHTPHQVLTTSSEPLCIWLAIHIFPNGIGPSHLDDPAGGR